jgi:hypothetical protein
VVNQAKDEDQDRNANSCIDGKIEKVEAARIGIRIVKMLSRILAESAG